MLGLSQGIDIINRNIGRLAAFAILISILISSGNALFRYVIGDSNNLMLTSQWWLFSIAFLFCAPWTLMLNEHIRIDILNSRFKPKTRYWIDIFGHACVLIPFCILMLNVSLPWAMRSVSIWEADANGGIPQWLAKILIPMAFSLLLLQGISELIKRVNVLRGKIPEPYKNLSSHMPPEVEILESPAKE